MKDRVWRVARRIALVGILAGAMTPALADEASRKLFFDGYELLKAGKAANATAKFRAGLKLEPESPLGHFYLGEALAKQGKKAEAKAAWEKSLALDPNGGIAAQARERLGLPEVKPVAAAPSVPVDEKVAENSGAQTEKPIPAQPVGKFETITLPSGILLSDWLILAESRLAKKEIEVLVRDLGQHLRTYGPQKPLLVFAESLVEQSVAAIGSVELATEAEVAIPKLLELRRALGEWPKVLMLLARAQHRSGNFTEAEETYKAWLRAAPSSVGDDRRLVLDDMLAAQERRPLSPFAGMKVGATFKDCDDCPEMLIIPEGSFDMGSPEGEAGRDKDEGPVHRVSIQRFALGRYEVTLQEFRTFVKATGYRSDAEKNADGKDGCFVVGLGEENGYKAGRYWDNPGFSQSGRQPVSCLSWNDAKAYVGWLAKKTGKTYRLASEAEWEYAARAGSQNSRPWGDDANQACRYGNVADTSNSPDGKFNWGDKRHLCNDGHWFSAPVGSYRPNEFGLYDMIGNVWEWVEDCGNADYVGAPSNGAAWTSGECGRRVLRGPSWNDFPQFARSAHRGRGGTGSRFVSVGFRVALSGARTN